MLNGRINWFPGPVDCVFQLGFCSSLREYLGYDSPGSLDLPVNLSIHRHLRWLLSLLPPLLLASATLGQGPKYSVFELDSLRGGDSFAIAMNLNGEIVGRSGRLHGTETQAFIWTPAKRIEVLSIGAASSNSRATGINRAGVVVGYRESIDSMRAFLWSRRDGFIELGTLPGDTSSKALGINDAGQVIGSSSGPSGSHAFLWSPGTGFRDLGTLPGGQLSEARGINSLGHVVGSSDSRNGSRAFLWTSETGLEDLGTLPNDTSSVAYSINDAGQVVGSSSGPSGVRAFLWSRSTGMRDLGALAGANYTEAYAINNDGYVVGISGSSAGTCAFIWTPAAGIRDLNPLLPQQFELVLAGALDINDHGLILAFGSQKRQLISDRNLEHGFHASPNRMFLLSPTAKP